MHYYKRNIGDYHKKAGRLSMVEHGAYTLLIDACYDRERFPTREDAIDWLWARSDEEIEAIDFVLAKFFDLQEDGTYIQSRIQDELDAYHAMAETNQRIARDREAKRRAAKNKKNGADDSGARSVHEACESVNESPPNQEPLTINQEPKINNNNSASDFSVIDSIADWIHPELREINDMLMLGAPPVPAISQADYDHQLIKFKNYYAEREIEGSYVRTEGRRKDILTEWIKRDYIRQQKIKAQSAATPRFNIDNEDWTKTTKPAADDSYHPSHSKPTKQAKQDPNTSVIVNGLWREPLPGMSVQQTYDYIKQCQMPGEMQDEAYDRLLNQMQEAV